MEAKEKANQLVLAFMRYVPADESMELPYSKKCALIAVEEIISIMPSVNSRPPNYQDINEYVSEYWAQVKTEIEAL